MSDEDLRSLIAECIRSELKSSILPMYERILADFERMVIATNRLLEESEGRIDSTHRMISKLADVAERGVAMFRNHVQSVEDTKNRSMNNCASLSEANLNLSRLLDSQSKQFSQVLSLISGKPTGETPASSVNVNVTK